MCGIIGVIDRRGETSVAVIKNMTNALYHRGPDDVGTFNYHGKYCQVSLGHRRLSIIDLSNNGHQPMRYKDLVIVYNGEVYNYKEIKKELIDYGYFFESDTDTEVVLKSFHCWGKSCVNKFNGMFAIAIYDIANEEIYLMRDRAGVKPLYWYSENGLFMFSSEIKGFHNHPEYKKRISVDSLSLFFQYGYIPEPDTIFNNTKKLRPGYILELCLMNNQIKEKKYWDIIDCYAKDKNNIDEVEAIEETERLLKKACNYRMVSDVPVGVFLSGGYDSSTVTALLQCDKIEKLKTFSVGFYEEDYNEAKYAKKVAEYLGTDHTEYYCTQKDALEIIPKIPEIWDEPFGDISAIPTTLVSMLARNKVTVSLSADGGDEIFGGYNKYVQTIKLHYVLKKMPMRKVLVKLLGDIDPKRIPLLNKKYRFDRRYNKVIQALGANDIISTFSSVGSVFTREEVKEMLNVEGLDDDVYLNIENIRDLQNDLDLILSVDFKKYQLCDILTKVDRATMSVGLEGREPLLDYNLVEFVARLDNNMKIRNGEKKLLLKTIAHKYLPNELMERPKMGFTIPLIKWFDEELKKYVYEYLDDNVIEKQGFFNVGYIKLIRDEYLSGKKEDITKIWLLIVFQLWYEKWMK